MRGWEESLKNAEKELSRLEDGLAKDGDIRLADALTRLSSPQLTAGVAPAVTKDPSDSDILDGLLGTLVVSQLESPSILNHVLASRVVQLYLKTGGGNREAFREAIAADPEDFRDASSQFPRLSPFLYMK
jgi:hypothetical protein